MSLSGNTEKINELLSKINALPEAGSGGGGAIESCTVTWYDYGTGVFLIYTKPDLTSGMFQQGEFVSKTVSFTVAKGSTVLSFNGDSAEYEMVNAEIVEAGYNDYFGYHYFVKITGNATVEG